MPFDGIDPGHAPRRARRDRGRRSYEAGRAAERAVARAYGDRGHAVAAERWRGRRGEIDLVVHNGAGLIFIEVKQSRDFATALSHVTPAQMARLYATAEEYLAHAPRGSLTEIRFDVAMVDGSGQVEILENAFGHG